MAVVDIQLLKQHVRADDFSDDDQYLSHLLAAAEEYITAATNRSSEELVTLGGGKYPESLQHAVLLMAGHWYNQREAVTGGQMSEVPYTATAIIKRFRKLGNDKSTTV